MRGIVLVLAGAMVASPALAGDVLFVDADAAPGGDGLSWETAFDDLWEALDAAGGESTVNQLWVAEGSYTPDRGAGDRGDSFDLVTGVAVLGGFAGDETSAEQDRDPAANLTILSGDFDGNDIASDTDGDGLVEFTGYGENALNVVAAEDVADARLDGFIIESGNANFDGEALRGGGGVFCFEATVTIDHCFFRFNTAGTESPDLGGFGGGVFVLGGDVTIADCLFEDNRGMNGGAMAAGSRPDLFTHIDVVLTVERCTVRRCFSDFQTGGAMWTATGDPLGGTTVGRVTVRECVFEDCFGEHHGCWTDQNTPELLVEDCIFRNNEGVGFGGGFSHSQSAGPDVEPAQVRRCVFEGNVAGSIGAAVLIQATNVDMESCMIIGNTGDSIVRTGPIIGIGGGGRSLTLTNCLIADNEGMGVLSDDAPLLELVNTTVANNVVTGIAVTAGGVVADIDGAGQQVVLDNSVFWGNMGTERGQAGQIQVLDGAPTVNFCLVEGLTGSFGGEGNNNGPPRFVDESAGNYRLSSGSAAIDAADNTRIEEGIATDLDGNPRFVDDPRTEDTGLGPPPVADMGAYEFQVAGTCGEDFDGDGVVGFTDLLQLLTVFGTSSRVEDLDGSGIVDFADLVQLLAAWGPC